MSVDVILNQLIVDKSRCESVHTQLPLFDRSQLKHGIVHLSVGNFHRAHVAYYMDVLASEHQQKDWGIVGVGVRSFDKPMSTVMKVQHGLYTLVTKGTNENDVNVRIVGSIINYIFAPDEPENALAVLVHPDTRIVSLTITESGYDLDMDNTDIQHDLKNFELYEKSAEADSPKKRLPYFALKLVRVLKAHPTSSPTKVSSIFSSSSR